MSKENVIIIQADTDPAKKSIKDLRKELKDLKDEMTNLEEGSDAFLEVANKAGEVKHQIDEINESIKGASSDFGDLVGNITNVAAGITGAFQAVAGGLQAMGIESKAIDETIARMQGLMAVTQGLGSIDTAIKSLDKLRNSITSTTGAAKLLKAALTPKMFLAITAAATALTFVFQKFRAEQERVAELTKKVNEEREKSKLEHEKKLQEEYNAALLKEVEIRKAYITTFFGKDTKGATEQLIKDYKGLISGLKDSIDVNKISQDYQKVLWDINHATEGTAEYMELQEKERKLRAQLWKARNDETFKTNIQNAISQYETLLETEKQRLEVIKVTEQAEADAAEERERIAQQRKSTNIPTLGNVIPLQIDPLPPATETLEDMGARIGQIIGEAEARARNEKWKESIEHTEQLGNEIFNTLKETTSAFSESSLGLTSGWITSLNTFQTVFQETMKLVKEEGTVSWTSYGQVAAQALGGIGQMLNALSNEQDASNEEGFKKTKQLQIAATVMNMLSGIMSAWSSAMSPANAWMTAPGQIAYGTIMSGLIAGIGAAQISKIQSQTMNSANPNTNINAKSTSSMIMPPVQYSQAVQGASTEGAIKDTKVYVTETDITSTINKVSVQENENRY